MEGEVLVYREDAEQVWIGPVPWIGGGDAVMLYEPLPSQGVADMTTLHNLHEASILSNLQIRHAASEPYTACAGIVVSLNPYQWFSHLYAAERMDEYTSSSSTPRTPHIYAVGATAYRNLMSSNQSILVSGESGAGKTETTKLLLKFLAHASSSSSSSGNNGRGVIQRIINVNPLLESFGNAKTVRNDNSSRFGKFTTLQFDRSTGALVGSQSLTYLLEKSRVVSLSQGERSYHVFYELLSPGNSGAARRGLFLANKSPKDFCYLRDGALHTSTIEGVTDSDRFARSMGALRDSLSLDASTVEAFQRALVAVLYLGQVSFACSSPGADSCFLSSESEQEHADCQAVMELLQVGCEELVEALTFRALDVAGEGRSIRVPLSRRQAEGARDALAKELYARLFSWLVLRVNLSTAASAPESPRQTAPKVSSSTTGGDFATISLLDIFGFESFAVNRMEQFLINMANEKLQQKFTQDVFQSVQKEYKAEGLDLEEISYADNVDVLRLIEGPRHSIISALSEECMMPKPTDAGFLNKLRTGNSLAPSTLLSFPPHRPKHFTLQHFAGRVEYSIDGFVDKNRDHIHADICKVVAGSENALIAAIFGPHAGLLSTLGLGSSVVGAGASSGELADPSVPALLQANPSSSACGTVGLSDNHTVTNSSTSHSQESSEDGPHSTRRGSSFLMQESVASKFKSQLAGLMADISKTSVGYVRCIKPNANKSAGQFDRKMVVQQLRSAGMVEAIKISRSAHPCKLPIWTFVTNYWALSRPQLNQPLSSLPSQHSAHPFWTPMTSPTIGNAPSSTDWAVRAAAEEILSSVSGETGQSSSSKRWAIGKTIVFFCAAVLGDLEGRLFQIRARSACIIQARFLGSRARRAFVALKKAALLGQSLWRRLRARSLFTRQRRAAATLQAFVRGLPVRRRFLHVMAAVKVVQKNAHAFLRFKRFRRQLCFLREEKRRREEEATVQHLQAKVLTLEAQATQHAAHVATLEGEIKLLSDLDEASQLELQDLRRLLESLEFADKRAEAAEAKVKEVCGFNEVLELQLIACKEQLAAIAAESPVSLPPALRLSINDASTQTNASDAEISMPLDGTYSAPSPWDRIPTPQAAFALALGLAGAPYSSAQSSPVDSSTATQGLGLGLGLELGRDQGQEQEQEQGQGKAQGHEQGREGLEAATSSVSALTEESDQDQAASLQTTEPSGDSGSGSGGDANSDTVVFFAAHAPEAEAEEGEQQEQQEQQGQEGQQGTSLQKGKDEDEEEYVHVIPSSSSSSTSTTAAGGDFSPPEPPTQPQLQPPTQPQAQPQLRPQQTREQVREQVQAKLRAHQAAIQQLLEEEQAFNHSNSNGNSGNSGNSSSSGNSSNSSSGGGGSGDGGGRGSEENAPNFHPSSSQPSGPGLGLGPEDATKTSRPEGLGNKGAPSVHVPRLSLPTPSSSLALHEHHQHQQQHQQQQQQGEQGQQGLGGEGNGVACCFGVSAPLACSSSALDLGGGSSSSSSSSAPSSSTNTNTNSGNSYSSGSSTSSSTVTSTHEVNVKRPPALSPSPRRVGILCPKDEAQQQRQSLKFETPDRVEVLTVGAHISVLSSPRGAAGTTVGLVPFANYASESTKKMGLENVQFTDMPPSPARPLPQPSSVPSSPAPPRSPLSSLSSSAASASAGGGGGDSPATFLASFLASRRSSSMQPSSVLSHSHLGFRVSGLPLPLSYPTASTTSTANNDTSDGTSVSTSASSSGYAGASSSSSVQSSKIPRPSRSPLSALNSNDNNGNNGNGNGNSNGSSSSSTGGGRGRGRGSRPFTSSAGPGVLFAGEAVLPPQLGEEASLLHPSPSISSQGMAELRSPRAALLSPKLVMEEIESIAVLSRVLDALESSEGFALILFIANARGALVAKRAVLRRVYDTGVDGCLSLELIILQDNRNHSGPAANNENEDNDGASGAHGVPLPLPLYAIKDAPTKRVNFAVADVTRVSFKRGATVPDHVPECRCLSVVVKNRGELSLVLQNEAEAQAAGKALSKLKKAGQSSFDQQPSSYKSPGTVGVSGDGASVGDNQFEPQGCFSPPRAPKESPAASPSKPRLSFSSFSASPPMINTLSYSSWTAVGHGHGHGGRK